MIGARAVVGAGLALLTLPLGIGAQEEPKKKHQVEIVKAVGCAEERAGDPASWWLTRATNPEVVARGVFNEIQVEEARGAGLGEAEFQLVGVADFLDAESLLAWGRRSEFTTRDQANATGELRAGRTVLVKGLLIEAEPTSRINLLAVVGLADDCG